MASDDGMAADAMASFAVETLQLTSLRARSGAINLPSLRVLAKLVPSTAQRMVG